VALPAAFGNAGAIEVELRSQPIGYRWPQNLDSDNPPEPPAFLRYSAALRSTTSTELRRAVVAARR